MAKIGTPYSIELCYINQHTFIHRGILLKSDVAGVYIEVGYIEYLKTKNWPRADIILKHFS